MAFKEVEDALVAVRTARQQIEAQEAQVASLKSALHLADLRYKGGISNYLDVLTARRSLFDAELSLAASDFTLPESLESRLRMTRCF